MQKYRIAILDYPKHVIHKQEAAHLLTAVIQGRQENYGGLYETYLSVNSLDMLSTHVLIYDTSNMFDPRPVLAIRNCYESRAHSHGLKLPVEEYIPFTPKEYQEHFNHFRQMKKEIVDCNIWFINKDYSWKNTNTPLSEIAWFILVSFTLRKGFDHWVGATNERFKASRWAAQTGRFKDNLIFPHPVLKYPHKLILIEQFNTQWWLDCYGKYKNLLENAYEVLPEYDKINERLYSVQDIFNQMIEINLKEKQIYTEAG